MAHVRKPHGGYRLFSVHQMCVAWVAYKSSMVSWLGFRVYLALQEVAARREAAKRNGSTCADVLRYAYVLDELLQLVGCARSSQISGALHQLERAGLVTLRDQLVELENPQGSDEVLAMERCLGRRGTVPMPRTALRFLSREGSAAVAAYMLGVALRCCHMRDRATYTARGRCSVRFVAEGFGLHSRTVKRAAAVVKSMSWVSCMYTRSRWTQRYGPVVQVNVAWQYSSIESPPRETPISTESPPPIRKQELLSDSRNQEPRRRRASGSCERVERDSGALRCLEVEELRERVRLQQRFDAAVAAGVVEPGAASELRFFAAAEHALRVAERNPCGLFVSTLVHHRCGFITQGDEDRARERLRLCSSATELLEGHRAEKTKLAEIVRQAAAQCSWPAGSDPTNNLDNPAIRAHRSSPARWPAWLGSPQTLPSTPRITRVFSANACRESGPPSCGRRVRRHGSVSPACHVSG